MQKSESPLVSVVTPVHNGEKYLDDCIRSVRKQTYENWEYIIVNNCSSDGTFDIASRHSAEDCRIRLVSTSELLPLIKNHNFALRQIAPESKYCKIVHADDMLLPICIEAMVEAAEKNPSAGIVGSYCLRDKKVVSDGIPLATELMAGEALCRETLLNKLYCFWSPSALLIRSEIVRERREFYGGGYLHADVEACYEILQESNFGFVHQVLTFIRKHEESATSTQASPFNTILVSNLALFLKYGPIFLSAEEYSDHLKRKSKKYYSFLAASLLDLREREFWRFHISACREMGFNFSWLAVVQVIVAKPLKGPVVFLSRLSRAIGRLILRKS
jgi:glycosyltransferase involved in cell wall biosynthesis